MIFEITNDKTNKPAKRFLCNQERFGRRIKLYLFGYTIMFRYLTNHRSFYSHSYHIMRK